MGRAQQSIEALLWRVGGGGFRRAAISADGGIIPTVGLARLLSYNPGMAALPRVLSPRQQLDLIIRRIVDSCAPDRIILYGSYAYGSPGPESDFDLLIIKETTEPPRERWYVVRKAIWPLPTTIPVAPLVLTEAELARRLEIGDQFFEEIVNRGRTVYDRQGLAHPFRVVRRRRARPESRAGTGQGEQA
jgi:predicted nucleotidyltransferase